MGRFPSPLDAIEDPPGFDPPILPQVQIDPVDFDMLDLADGGEGVLNGCLVSASSPEALSVDVASGQVAIDGVIVDVAAQPDVSISTPNATQPRFDLVTVDDAGDVTITDGLPADFSPLFPNIPADSVALAVIYVRAGMTLVTEDHITNKRSTVPIPPGTTSDWIPVRASVDDPRNNDAALTADDELHFTMAANTKYAVRGHIVISALAASDARYGFLGPNSPVPTFINISGSWHRDTATARTPFSKSAFDTTGLPLSSTLAADYSIDFEAIVHNSSDTTPDFAFAWGQNTAVAENTIRRAASWIEYVPL